MTRTIDNLEPAFRPFWHPVAYAGDLGDAPKSVTLLGDDYVVVRLGGELLAFVDRCPHRLAPLSAGSVVDGALQCGYHGYRFDRDGRCVRIPSQDAELPIPSRACVAAVGGVTERYGIVWLAPEPPVADVVECAEYDDPEFVPVGAPPQRWQAGAAQILDNLVDYAHFAYRHASTFGGEDEIDISADLEVERDGWTITGSHFQMVKDPEDPDPDRKVQPREMHFVYAPPFTLVTRVVYPNTGLVTVLFAAIQPETLESSVIFGSMIRSDLRALGITEMHVPPDFEDTISNEDRWMLERFTTKAVPIDLPFEVHTKSDRMMVEFRRAYADAIDHYEREHAPTPHDSTT